MESLKNKENNASIKHLMPPGKAPNATKRLHVVDSWPIEAPKYHMLLSRLLVPLYNLVVGLY